MIVFSLFPTVDVTPLVVILVVMTGSALLALLALAMNQPILPRMGLRNMLRRPRQTVVLLSGLALSTVVIAASFGLWDNLPHTSVSVVAGKVFFASSAGLQFYWLLPLLSVLLVGAGMLLQALLLSLLVAERRTELGMSRALGLQRSHLTQMLLFECVSYGLVAIVVGVPLGLLLTSLELGVLSSQLPGVTSTVTGKGVHLSLAVRLDWQGLVGPCCLSLLVTILTVWLTATWISRLSIVAAIRDLDAPLSRRWSLVYQLRALWHAPRGRTGQPVAETPGARFARRRGAVLDLLWGVFVRGPFCLLVGGVLFILARTTGQHWMVQLAVALVLAGLGLLVGWLLPLSPSLPVTKASARRLCFSLIGLGWLVFGLQSGDIFLTLFEFRGVNMRTPSALELLLGLLLPVLGAVVLVLTNADGLGALGSLLLRHTRGLAPLSRSSLVYPLTLRFRTGLTVALLSLLTFLVVLVVTANLGALQEAQAVTNNGGYQLEVDLHNRDGSNSMVPPEQMAAIQSHQLLGQDFSAVGLLRPLFTPPLLNPGHPPAPVLLDLPGRPAYRPRLAQPFVADAAFLSTTLMPTLARTQGYSSDEQVWNAVRDHPGDAVLSFLGNLGLPTGDGFVPFTAEVPDGPSSSAHYHRVTIIGILGGDTAWQQLFMSQRTAAQIVQSPYTGSNFYLFRLQPGVSQQQASQDLRRTLVLAPNSVWDPNSQFITLSFTSLDQIVTEVILFMLSNYLALGLLFGALAIGVIASRAVVERRQQIGMLRALGFSRSLVLCSFLLETGFVVTLSLLVGTSLALWQAYRVALQMYRNMFPVPVGPVVLILLGSYVVVFVTTLFPARQAARLHPAEALRYE